MNIWVIEYRYSSGEEWRPDSFYLTREEGRKSLRDKDEMDDMEFRLSRYDRTVTMAGLRIID